jgi:hypothetical protein
MSQQHIKITNDGPNSVRVIRTGMSDLDIAPSTTPTTLPCEAEIKIHPLDANGNDLAGGGGEE